MKLKDNKSGFVFTPNPIVITEEYPDTAFDKNGVRYVLSMYNKEIYEGRFFPPFEIELSEILDAHSEFFPEPTENPTSPIIEIENATKFKDRICNVSFTYGNLESETDFTVIPGGVSKQNFRRMTATGQDIFNSRFLNTRNNFFLTTRTAGWCIYLKETELYPLYFLIKDNNTSIKIREHAGTNAVTFDNISSGVYALDIDALRRKFMTQHNVLASVFDIYFSGVYSCRVVVERSYISKQRHRLKFRNSLGVYEIIELTGELSTTPDYSKSEEDSFSRYDSVTSSFHSDRERIQRSQSITVETGVKRPDETRFLMDMLGSDDVYLLDVSQFPLKVIPGIENITYKEREDAPQTYSLKLEISDSETNIMQDIVDGSENRKPRTFSHLFGKQFN